MAGVSKDSDTITVPSIADRVATVDEFLENWLRGKKVPEDTIADLAIAVTELVNNAIKYGNKNCKDKKVTVSLRYRRGEIEASVMDEGEGFDPEGVPNPLAEENLLKEIGRGIFIVKSLMDDLKFTFSPRGGTKAVIVKRIA